MPCDEHFVFFKFQHAVGWTLIVQTKMPVSPVGANFHDVLSFGTVKITLQPNFCKNLICGKNTAFILIGRHISDILLIK